MKKYELLRKEVSSVFCIFQSGIFGSLGRQCCLRQVALIAKDRERTLRKNLTLLQRSQHSSQHIASRCAAEVADDWAARVAAKPALQAVLQVGGGATASAGQVGVTSLRAAQRPTPRATLAQMPATRSGRAPSSLEALAPRSHVYFVARCLRLFPSRAAATTEVARWCVQLAGQWAAKPFAAGYGAFVFSPRHFFQWG